jgi:5'(3')-deoxyribonucleotidase
MKKILYIDMDNVIVDFQSGIDSLNDIEKQLWKDNYDECPYIFSEMKPLHNSIESLKILNKKFDIYILSTVPWNNSTAWADKVEWVKKYLGNEYEKKLILSHNKHLNFGDYLIDDRTANGADKFKGELILFGSEKFKNWEKIINYLC